MARQAYGGWRTLVIESLVRSCVVRYYHEAAGAQKAARLTEIERDMRRFLAVDKLSAALEVFEKNRSEYEGLDDFVPQLVGAFRAVPEDKRYVPLFELPEELEPVFGAEFSPNRERYAFSGYEWEDERKREAGLWVYYRETGKTRLLMRGELRTPLAWHPDNRRLAISTGEGLTVNHSLALIDTATRKRTMLGVKGAAPAFSPKGDQIAFCGGFREGTASLYDWVPTNGEIYLMKAAPGAKPRRISRSGRGAILPVWSPDGSRIAYQVLVPAAGSSGGRRPAPPRAAEIYVVKVNECRSKRVYTYQLPKSGEVGSVLWTEDCQKLLLETEGAQPRLVKA